MQYEKQYFHLGFYQQNKRHDEGWLLKVFFHCEAVAIALCSIKVFLTLGLNSFNFHCLLIDHPTAKYKQTIDYKFKEAK